MMEPGFDRDWGHWVLGDLSDVLRRVADVIGRSIPVSQVQVWPAASEQFLPTVAVTVEDSRDVFRLRTVLAAGEYSVQFLTPLEENGWTAEVQGIELSIVFEEEQ